VISVSATNLGALTAALEAALRGSGPAVLPLAASDLVRASDDVLLTQVGDDVAVVVQTSGSTAAPKRVCLSADALIASARATHARLGGAGQWLMAVPANYIAGLQILVRSLDSGIDPHIASLESFSPQSFVAAIEGMTGARRYASVVPAQLQRLVELATASTDARRSLTRLDALLVGGQAVSTHLRAEAERLGLNLVRSYGSTETSGGCVYDGVPLEGVELGLEETGELRIRGNILALEYTEQRLTDQHFVERDGQRWYLTGDDAEITDGVLRVIGRRNRSIISGGIKVSLDEVDATVAEVLITRFATVSVENEQWGERPVLVAQGVGSPELDDEVRAVVLERLGKVAVPDRILWVSELPTGATGKPDLVAIARLATA